MSATRDLIAAALTAAGAVRWQYPELSDELRELCARAMVQPDILRAENKRLRAELETERIRLAACGVVALSNTPESAEKARKMLPEYRSGSCDDVARMVDQQMDLRAENERLNRLYVQAVKSRADMRSALRDARAAAPQPIAATEVAMPQGYAERPSDYTGSIWVESQMRTYGDAREAAGYARGKAENAKDAKRYRWLRDTGDASWRPFALREGYSAADADAAIDAALRGEVK